MGRGMTAKKKSGHKAPFTMTRAKVISLKQQVTWQTCVVFLACGMDELDWTEDDITDFSTRLERYMNAAESHIITYSKISKILKERLGIDIRVQA